MTMNIGEVIALIKAFGGSGGGSSGGGVLVTELDTGTLNTDKTAGEIYDAYVSGTTCYIHDSSQYCQIIWMAGGSSYSAAAMTGGGLESFNAASSNSPLHDDGGWS